VFNEYDKIVLHNLENDSNTEISSFFSGAPAWSVVYWINQGDQYLENLELEPIIQEDDHSITESIFSSNAQQPDLINILEANYNITGNHLEITIKLVNIPERITVNRERVCEGCEEYSWGAYIDVDNDKSTGRTEFGDGGWDYALELSRIKFDKEEDNLPISIAFNADVWEIEQNSSRTIDSQVDFSIDSDENTMKISGNIPGLSPTSKILFFAFDFLSHREFYSPK
jgi:hypothetical protein